LAFGHAHVKLLANKKEKTMKKRISRLSVLQTGKFLGLFYGLFAAIALPFMLVGLATSSGQGASALLMLLMYPIIGFIGGILLAVFYNLVATWIGGIEVTLEDSLC
jgi:hypothetical protein